jgi:hypothetical protein
LMIDGKLHVYCKKCRPNTTVQGHGQGSASTV